MTTSVSISVAAFEQLILDMLSTGPPSIDRAARRCGIPVRTLQRRLHDAGLSYSELLDEVRFGAAHRLLDDARMRTSDIARILGYADPSNFSRAFTRWTGLTPREYRNRLAGTRGKLRNKRKHIVFQYRGRP